MPRDYFKKTLAGIFALAIVASATPLAPFAPLLDSISITASAAETEDGFIYAANADGTVTITGYNGAGGDVVIPSTIDGAAVTAIGREAFRSCKGINSITVPEGVLSIGTAQDEFGVFEDCSMQSISLPSTLLYIWSYAFASTQLTEITFPDSVIKIGDEVFFGCTELKSITAPCRTEAKEELWKPKECSPEITYNHVYEAGADVCVCGKTSYFEFDSAAGIISGYNGTNTSVKVPEKIDGIAVTAIADDAFSDCDFIETISAPCAVSGEWSKNCKAAVSHYNHVYAKGAAECNCGEASVYAYEENEDGTITLTRYLGGDSEVVVPAKLFGKTVSKVKGAFCYNGNITKVVISEGITCIDDSLFQDCGNLKEVVLPLSLKTIGMYVFCNCTGLESITIPENVETIGIQAFQYCSNLKEIHMLGKTPPETHWTAFSTECNSVESIYVPYGTEDDYEAFPLLFPREDVSEVPTIIHPPYPSATYVLGGKGENFTNSADSDMMLTEPEKPLADGYAFAGWYTDDTFTTKFDFTKGIDEDIKIYAKWEETATVTFDMQGNGTQIAPVSIVNGNTITEPEKPSVDGYDFGGWYTDKDCTDGNLFDFSTQITDDITLYAKWSKSRNAILDSNLTYEIDEEGVLTITGDDTAFPDCVDNYGEIRVWCDEIDKVTKIVFDTPNLTSIGTAAFINFTALETVELPDTVETIGHQAFRNCKELDTVTIPSSVTSIGINSFNGCASLKSISIPESVTSISDYTFASCSLLASVKMGSKVESIGKSAFDGCANLKSIEIPDSVTSIGNYSFRGCSALTSVNIGKGVASIGSQVFSDCIGLTSITFPNSVTSIGAQVCSGCTGLTSITFGSSVASIGMGALYKCSSLTSISFNGDMPNEINTNAFVSIGTVETPVSLFYPTDNQTWDGIEEAVHSKQWNGGYFEAMTAVIKGYSVSYDGDITIKFHYFVSDFYNNGYIKFSDGTQVSASDAVKDANGYFVFPISMPAKNMYDEITAQFYDENDVAIGNAVTFDLATYMDKVKAYDPNYSDFVDSFLEYGKQAAAYFGVTGAPAGKTYSDSDFASISNTLEANYASTDNMGDTFVGATLLLKSMPKLRLYYSEDPGNYSTNEKNPDLFYTEKEISPVKFGTEDLNGYYVYNYIYKAMNSDDSGLKALCAALYNMSKAIPAVG